MLYLDVPDHSAVDLAVEQVLSPALTAVNGAFVATISNFGRSQAYLWSNYRDWDKVQVIRCGLDDAQARRRKAEQSGA